MNYIRGWSNSLYPSVLTETIESLRSGTFNFTPNVDVDGSCRPIIVVTPNFIEEDLSCQYPSRVA